MIEEINLKWLSDFIRYNIFTDTQCICGCKSKTSRTYILDMLNKHDFQKPHKCIRKMHIMAPYPMCSQGSRTHVCMGVHAYICMGMYEYVWVCMGIRGYVWAWMCMYGYVWIYRYAQSYGYVYGYG